MSSVNKAIIVGNLGKDPQIRYTQSGVPFCAFSVATTDHWTDQHGQRQEKTEWHRITVWKKPLLENCAKYLRKGSSAYIEGRMQTRSWDDPKHGDKRYSTDIIAHEVKFLGPATNNQAENHDPQSMDVEMMTPLHASELTH
jgi:single-strand DNA-binding protein